MRPDSLAASGKRLPRPWVRLMGRALLSALAGAILGAAAKWADLYWPWAAEISSQLMIWLVLGAAVSLHSGTPKRAALYVLALCAGMLPAYYLTAHVLGAYYSAAYAWGWAGVALTAPVCAWICWYAGGRGPLAHLLRAGALVVAAGATVFLFGALRPSDLVLLGALAWLLYSPGGGRHRRI